MCGVPPAFSADQLINIATSVPACWPLCVHAAKSKKQFLYKEFQIRMNLLDGEPYRPLHHQASLDSTAALFQ
jgi:hypothetical protein